MFFDVFNSWKIDISWTLIKIGYNFSDYSFRISRNEIIEYATYVLESNEDNPALTDLIFASDSKNELNEVLDELIRSEDVCLENEQRKWVLYVLWKAVSALSEPPTMEELFCLGDLWYDLGRPMHYPWDVKKCEYIKCTDYDDMINTHMEWLNTEIEVLKRQ